MNSKTSSNQGDSKKGLSLSLRFLVIFLTIVLGVIVVVVMRFYPFYIYQNGCVTYCEGEICTDEDLASLSASGSGSDEDPYIIVNRTFVQVQIKSDCISSSFIMRNCLITYHWNEYYWNGFTIGDTDQYISIENNTFESGFLGIANCKNVNISNNTFLEDSTGLTVGDYCINVNITGNHFVNGGIIFSPLNDIYFDFAGEFANNFANGKPIGFFRNMHNLVINESYSQIFVLFSMNITILNQTISNTFVGIDLYRCSNVTIRFCQISNSAYGVTASYVFYFLIEKNEFIDNYWEQVNIWDSNCTVYNNNFIKNNPSDYNQAEACYCQTSIWDYNYWSDWDGVNPYPIGDCTADQTFDNYPLENPLELF